MAYPDDSKSVVPPCSLSSITWQKPPVQYCMHEAGARPRMQSSLPSSWLHGDGSALLSQTDATISQTCTGGTRSCGPTCMPHTVFAIWLQYSPTVLHLAMYYSILCGTARDLRSIKLALIIGRLEHTESTNSRLRRC